MLKESIEIITIGLPFCVFKMVTGLLMNQYWLVGLGVLDSLINGVNLILIVLLRKRVWDACSLSFLVRLFKKPNLEHKEKWQDFGNALDVLLSFSLVAYVIGGGFIQDVPSKQLWFWNLSVVLNVFGAGYSRMTGSIENLKTS